MLYSQEEGTTDLIILNEKGEEVSKTSLGEYQRAKGHIYAEKGIYKIITDNGYKHQEETNKITVLQYNKLGKKTGEKHIYNEIFQDYYIDSGKIVIMHKTKINKLSDGLSKISIMNIDGKNLKDIDIAKGFVIYNYIQPYIISNKLIYIVKKDKKNYILTYDFKTSKLHTFKDNTGKVFSSWTWAYKLNNTIVIKQQDDNIAYQIKAI